MTTKKFKNTKENMMGSFFLSSGGTDCVVINYKSCLEVTVMFLDKYEHKVTTSTGVLRRSFFANPYDRTVCGVGYFGVGVYKAREVPESCKKTKAYEVWRGIIKRCYSEKSFIRSPSYRDCTICDEWLNFQVFADWYVNHDFYGLGYDLDKDILVEGNKVYSPETCCLVPKQINLLFNSNKKARGEYPLGVTKEKGRYLVQLSVNGKNVRVGVFTDVKDAFCCYKKAKEDQVKSVAEYWRHNICDVVYKKLMSWELIL